MHRSKRSALALASTVLVLAAPSSARSQLHVVDLTGGPGSDFVQISEAVLAAADGDTILVRPGHYGPIVVEGKSLTIVAEAGATVDLRQVTVQNLAAGGRVLLRGIGVDESSSYTPAAVFSANAGLVWAEGCAFVGRDGDSDLLLPDGGDGIRIDGCAGVVLVRTRGSGGRGGDLVDEDFHFFPGDGAPGLRASDSAVSVLGGTLEGGFGGSVSDTVSDDGGDGGDGIRVEGGSVTVSGAVATGRNGGAADEDTLFGFCGNGGGGGDGIALAGLAEGYVRDTTATGGLGGGPGGASCVPGPDGVPVGTSSGATVTGFPAGHQSLAGNSPVREGETLSLQFAGEPGQLALFAVGVEPAHLPLPALQGTSLVQVPALLRIAGILNGAGERTLSIGLSDVTDPGTALTLYLQGLFYDAATEELTLGSGTAVTLLDVAD